MANLAEHIHIPTETRLCVMIENVHNNMIACATYAPFLQQGVPVDYHLVSHSGLDYCDRELTGKEYAQQDGGYIAGNRKKMRRITLILKKHKATADDLRPAVFFASKSPYTIRSICRVTNKNVSLSAEDGEYVPFVAREITGYLEHIERIGNPGVNAPIILQLTFLCPSAYFGDVAEDATRQHFGSISGGLQYLNNKLQYSTDKRLIQYERLSFTKNARLYNRGSVETGFVLTVTTTAPVSQFYIKVNGETAQFGDIPKDSVFVFDTNNRTVTLNGSNAYALSKNKVFPLIRPGENIVEISNITGSAFIKFLAKHEGVF